MQLIESRSCAVYGGKTHRRQRKPLGVAETMMRGPVSAANDLAAVKLASIRIWLRAIESMA
ncbi:hypothetical protein [Tardiphaga sp. 839_C3_N1_4]|uniref:hypothetical protein n=1 Tax=Tardiphaga sp. 839_C3_N1_4 TaxID=3240761 RepID=UPI003F25AB78